MEEKDRQGVWTAPCRRQLAVVREHDETALDVDRVQLGIQCRVDSKGQVNERVEAPIAITLTAPLDTTKNAPLSGMQPP